MPNVRIKVVIGSLQLEAEGPHEFMEERFDGIRDAFLQVLFGERAHARHIAAGTEPMSFREYWEKHPTDVALQLAALAASYNQDVLGMDGLSASEFLQRLQELPSGQVKLPKKPDQTLRDAGKKEYGWLVRSRRGVYRITPAGRNLINQLKAGHR